MAAELEQAPAPQGPPSWVALRFEARKALVLSGSVDVVRADVAPLPAEPWLAVCGEPPGAGTSPVALLSATTRAGGRLLTRTWLDPRTGAVVEIEEEKPSRRWKRQRFGPAGACEERARPARARREREQPHARWTDRTLRLVTAPQDAAVPTGSFGLLDLAARLARSDAGSTSAWAVSRGRAVMLTLARDGSDEVPPRVTLAWADGAPADAPPPSPGRVERVVVHVRDGSSGEADDEQGALIFGLVGRVEILVETAFGVPVEIRGTAPRLGRVRVRLASARVRWPEASGR